MEYKYYAFISYKREDERWAKWLQKKLEAYGFPVALRKANPSLPSKIRPIFRDQSELSGGNLKEEIEKGLKDSKYLLVVCSPRSAQSPWVSKEVQYFIDKGKENNIIPFIIGGVPNATNSADECFPEGLRNLSGEKEILGININEMGRDAAVIKVIARMFDLRFDTLWQRNERIKRRKRILILACVLVFAMVGFLLAGIMSSLREEAEQQRYKAEEQTLIARRENQRANIERVRANEQTEISEKERANALRANKSLKTSNNLLTVERMRVSAQRDCLQSQITVIRSLKAMEAIGSDDYLASKIAIEALSAQKDNVPPETEMLLRKAYRGNNTKVNLTDMTAVTNIFLGNDGKIAVALFGGHINYIDLYSRKIIKSFKISLGKVHWMDISQDGRYIVTSSRGINIIDTYMGDILYYETPEKLMQDSNNIPQILTHFIFVKDSDITYVFKEDTGIFRTGVLEDHSDKITSIFLDKSNCKILTSSLDKTVIFWDPRKNIKKILITIIMLQKRSLPRMVNMFFLQLEISYTNGMLSLKSWNM